MSAQTGGRVFRTSDLLGGADWMYSAPKDGTEIEILFRNASWHYATGDEKKQWQQWCRARWTDFNGGGWVWHGIAGRAICWRAVQPNAQAQRKNRRERLPDEKTEEGAAGFSAEAPCWAEEKP